jgi:hypothetical protein
MKGTTMARILVQTNDYRTVLDERNVQLADINDKAPNAELIQRLGRAIQDSERRPSRRSRSARHLVAIAPAKGYLELNG